MGYLGGAIPPRKSNVYIPYYIWGKQVCRNFVEFTYCVSPATFSRYLLKHREMQMPIDHRAGQTGRGQQKNIVAFIINTANETGYPSPTSRGKIGDERPDCIVDLSPTVDPTSLYDDYCKICKK